jgi:hypothetical protein
MGVDGPPLATMPPAGADLTQIAACIPAMHRAGRRDAPEEGVQCSIGWSGRALDPEIV